MSFIALKLVYSEIIEILNRQGWYVLTTYSFTNDTGPTTIVHTKSKRFENYDTKIHKISKIYLNIDFKTDSVVLIHLNVFHSVLRFYV